MLVTLQSRETIETISLPEKIKGQYWLTGSLEEGEPTKLLEIEGVGSAWMMKSTNEAFLVSKDETQVYRSCELKEFTVYRAVSGDAEKVYFVYVEPDTLDRKLYTKYQLRYEEIKITIGRNDKSDICYSSQRVSSDHATLEVRDSRWYITDHDSTNGTYVNGRRLHGEKQLTYGDVIYIVGMKIIVCHGFLAMNCPDHHVTINHNLLVQLDQPNYQEMDTDDIHMEQPDYYWRSPRFKRDIKEKVIKVDAPPASYKREELPLLMILGPSITMGIASITTASYSIYNAVQNGNFASAIPSMTMAVSMLMGTVLWPILSKRYEKKRNAEKEAERVEAYSAYLNEIQKEANQEAEQEKRVIEGNNRPPSEWADVIRHRERTLWQRSNGQNDFLEVRVGISDMQSKIKYNYQERRFTMDKDDLQKRMLEICENPPELKAVPHTVSLRKDYILGVIADPDNSLLRSVLIQMSGQYGYDEVKFAFIMNESQEKELSFVRRLPHIWNNEKTFRYLATDYMEIKELSNHFEQILERRIGSKGEELEDDLPYVIFFVLDKKLADKAEVLKRIYKNKKYINMSVLYFSDELKKLPKECSKIIELFGDRGRIYDKNDITGNNVSIVPEYYKEKDLDGIAEALADTELDLTDSAYNLPKMITFLDMYGAGKIEHLNAELRWRDNNPVKSLAVPVGVDTMGEIFNLDLHEKFHGPHGLVAGMTGSGKSEFIMTYILSLALNYHPYEVAFVLIDYKGGGMAKAFEKLPHTAGIITNLDGAAVNRSLISIQSELKRRQAVFSKAGELVGESNVDIYKYQQLFREGKVPEPLPHLFIISDEFAELKTQQPDFMAQLISAARIGRSLGVHLILATQKPAGVVDDQIWSNSKFRVCLKVQDRSDSMDMLKRPDAASLSDTGRFYLQVGYDELFELGQSAWAGAPYYPSEKVIKKRDTTVELLDRCGMPVIATRLEEKREAGSSKKQLDEITMYLAHLAKEDHVQIRPLWLEPIPEKIYVDALRKKYHYTSEPYVLDPVIGEYDDPARQRQELLTLPLSNEGNTLVYGTAGNGKTTFLSAMIYSILRDHTPEQVTVYILDFYAETLRVFGQAPQIGDVLVSNDGEKILQMFKRLNAEIQKRKELCSEYGGNYASYIATGHTDLPNIVIVIHNYSGFVETYSDYEEYVHYQAREGIKYGIYYVITSATLGAVGFKLQQNFKQSFVLQMNDKSDYSAVLGSTGGMVPSKYKGRGLVRFDEIYEFQTAHALDSLDKIRDYCEELAGQYGRREPDLPIIPEYVTAESFECDITLDKLPIGIEEDTGKPVYVNLCEPPITPITGKQSEVYESFVIGITEQLAGMETTEIMMIDGSQSLNEDDIPCKIIQEDYEDEIVGLYQLASYRHKHYDSYGGNLPEDESFQEKVVILYQYHEILQKLTEDGQDKLKTVLDKTLPEYCIRFLLVDTEEEMIGTAITSWFRNWGLRKKGIWVGEGLGNSSLFDIHLANPVLKKAIESPQGFMIQDGIETMEKLLVSQREAENE